MLYNVFIEKANKVHSNKYTYPLFEDENDKIRIICPEHGEFKQNIYAHLKGQGCPNCLGRRGLTTETYIQQCKQKFGDKFDYSDTVYKNRRTKVIIKCADLITEDNKDGSFEMLPLRHLDSPTGMPFKGNRGREYPKLTDEDVIYEKTKIYKEKIKNILDSNYTYDRFIYTGTFQKCIVTCPIHGDFSAMANSLLSGHGCPECAKNKRLTVDDFIKKANVVHNNKYIYTNVKFNNSNDDVEIICPEHGVFKQNVTHHLRGHGCPKCAKNIPLTTEEFVQRAIKVHGDKYDYSKSVYDRHNHKLCIICKEHGEFWQTPNSHLDGKGCPICSQSHLEFEIQKLLTENKIEFEQQYKFDFIKDTRELPFDFYLKNYNTVIECQGVQHFKGNNTFYKDFEDRLKKDKIKYTKCIENGINILYYTQEKNIKSFINENKDLFEGMYDNNFFTNKKDLLNKIRTTQK